MSDSVAARRERLETLLADDAMGQLNDAERRELADLLKSSPEISPTDLPLDFERAAAAIDLACQSPGTEILPDSLPDALRRKILADACPFVGSSSITKLSVTECSGENEFGENAATASVLASPPRESKSFDATRWLGWLCAIAASVLFVVVSWRTRTVDVSQSPPLEVENASSSLSSAEMRRELLVDKDTNRYVWKPGPTPPGDQVSGDVVWNQRTQSGYMSFDGLKPNDPAVEQYQLWIIDPQRDQHPIDGGVFDIVQTGKAIVPIDAKLRVVDPQAFAITIEKPGGVVVSDQSRLPLLAAVGEAL